MDKNQLTYAEAVEQIRAAHEHEKIVLTTKISTLEVSISQQSIKIKSLEEQLKTLIQETNNG